jgi:DNA polymerase I
LTVTGRLSSVAPNLQNIPNRSEEGRKIRQNIIVPENCTLVKADYSQVELRILAHVANIKVLRDAFLNGQDVHKITASQVFQIPVEDVTKDLRQKAKAIK